MFNNRLGDRWWFYYALDWSDVLLRTEIINRDLGALTVQEPYHTAIFTNACEMEHLEYLIQALPNVHFHILAHTVFASQVVDLQRYLNVTIYPCFNQYNFETVLEKIDFLILISIILMKLCRLHRKFINLENQSTPLTILARTSLEKVMFIRFRTLK